MMGNANQPMVYTVWNGKAYSTNSLPDPLQPYTLDLGVKRGPGGQPRGGLFQYGKFSASAFIYLEDTQTNTWQDVRVNDTYSAVLPAGADENRFGCIFILPYPYWPLPAPASKKANSMWPNSRPPRGITYC